MIAVNSKTLGPGCYFWRIDENEDAIIEALNRDLNRTPLLSVLADISLIKGDIIFNLNNVDSWARGEAPKGAGILLVYLEGAWLRREPLGACLVIGARNLSLSTLHSPALQAIAAGNCVLLKPSELASATQDALVDLVPRYLDPTAIQLIRGGATEMTHVLTHNFDHICYTGGANVGRIIAIAAAKHLTPVILGLGVQVPAIVTKSAKIVLAAKRIDVTKLMNSGQICLNVDHVSVDPDIHDSFVVATKKPTTKRLSDGVDDLATIINKNHYKKLFAPLIPVLKADMKAAIETISGGPRPLGSYTFPSSQKVINHTLDNISSGGVTINDMMLHPAVPNAPFGGVGDSGYGAYQGVYGFDAFSHTRTVVGLLDWMDMLQSWRYGKINIENRKYTDVKPSFRKGEILEDQKVRTFGFLGLW